MESSKLSYDGHDEEAYQAFIRQERDALIRRGWTEKEATRSAEATAEMYRHHFRKWRPAT